MGVTMMDGMKHSQTMEGDTELDGWKAINTNGNELV